MYLYRIVLFFITTLSLNLAYAQKDILIPVNQRVILNYLDYNVYAHVLSTENKIKVSDDLYYYWFSANDIKRTIGGYDGKLLHGLYTEFYLNKNLREKGEFKYGLKKGEWKGWYINGEYKEISNWRKGKRNGRYRLYNEKGMLTEEGNYNKGFLNGRVIKYDGNGGFIKEKYKDGELVKKKERSKKPFLFFKKKDKNKKQSEGIGTEEEGTKPLKKERKSKKVKEEKESEEPKTKKPAKSKKTRNNNSIY